MPFLSSRVEGHEAEHLASLGSVCFCPLARVLFRFSWKKGSQGSPACMSPHGRSVIVRAPVATETVTWGNCQIRS